jgi:hypothetical protein
MAGSNQAPWRRLSSRLSRESSRLFFPFVQVFEARPYLTTVYSSACVVGGKLPWVAVTLI